MKLKTAAAAVALLLLTSAAPPALAQTQRRATQAEELRELREEVRRLREEQEGMRKDLQEIRRLLEQQARAGEPALPEFVSVDDDPSQGSPDARVVIIDFSDYQ